MIQELKGVKTIKETEGFGPYELEEFFDVALDLLCIADTDGYFIKVNKAWSDILGYPKDVLEERKFLDFVHPEDIQSTLDVISKLENQEQVLNFTNRYKAKDGSYRFIEWRSQPKGNLIYAAARDITEHKEMEENLRQREAHLRGILESQFDLIVRVDLENRFTYVNDAYCKTFGKKQEELLGQSFTPLVHIDDIDSTLKAMEKLFEPPYRVYIEQRAMTVKGWRWIAWEDSSILNERGEVVEIQGVGRDITQYKLAEEDLKMAHLELENRVLARTKELKNANEQLEKASKFKSEFLANMSHEVRNPMNAVTGLCQLALKKNSLKEIKEYIKKIQISSTSLLHIINDILDYSKIEAGKLEITDQEFSLLEIMESIQAIFYCETSKKELDLNCQIDPNIPESIIGDPQRLSQVLINIVGNAAKFTEVGRIDILAEAIEISSSKVTILFTIADTGIGISEHNKGKVFEAFSQGDGSAKKVYGGTGLGLTISKNLVELMGGQIWFESQLSKGSTFYFSIPFTVVGGSKTINLIKVGEKTNRILQVELTNTSVLLVEDNILNQEIIKEFLEDNGIKVTSAINGQEAIELVKNNSFDVIFMDIQMPLIDGYETSQAIKAIPGKGNIPIIAITGNAMIGDDRKAMNAGMIDYIAKPFNLDVLLDKIRLIKSG